MNLFRLTDQQRIMFLKGVIAGMGASSAVMLFRAAQTMAVLEKSIQKSRNLAYLQHQIIKRFAELSPAEVSSKVVDEFGFDVVTLNFNL